MGRIVRNSLSNLPNELILEIFKKLPLFEMLKYCPTVCKTWYELSHNPVLFRKVDLNSKHVPLHILVNLIFLGAESLHLKNAKVKEKIADNFLLGMDITLDDISKKSKVRYLNLESATMYTETIAKLLFICAGLQELDISHLTLKDAICGQIREQKNLQKLYMKDVKRITVDRIRDICLNCNQLKELSLSDCGLSKDTFNELCKVIPLSVTHLDISSCHELKNKHLQRITLRCSKLVLLNIDSCSALTPIGINLAIQNLQNLQELNLNKLYISLKIKRINKHFKKLDLFGAKGLTSDGIEHIFLNWPLIQELNLRHCHLSKEALDTLCNSIPLSVKYLDISECRELQDRHVLYISWHCPHLIKLHIKSCPKLTSGVVKFIAMGFLKLQELYISHTLISPVVLTFLQDISTLRTLKIHGIEDLIVHKNLNKVLKNIDIYYG